MRWQRNLCSGLSSLSQITVYSVFDDPKRGGGAAGGSGKGRGNQDRNSRDSDKDNRDYKNIGSRDFEPGRGNPKSKKGKSCKRKEISFGFELVCLNFLSH